MSFISFNGKIVPATAPVLPADNRGYRYGDGVFETIRVWKDRILLQDMHFERLSGSLALLKFDVPPHFISSLEKEILSLCHKNKCNAHARVRLSVSRGNGGLYDPDNTLQYIIECWPLDISSTRINENGLVIDIFPDSRKSIDRYSQIKSSSFQPYSMAAIFAKKYQLNDCLILNSSGSIADSTIANIFLVKGRSILTPPLSSGCIAGVMRRYLLEQLHGAGYDCTETAIREEDLVDTDELFLTNAIKGIRWVKQYRNKTYGNRMAVEIFDRFVKTILV